MTKRDTLEAVIAEMRRANTRWAPSLERTKQGPVRYVRWEEVQAWASRLASLSAGENERLIEQRCIGHGEGQRDAIADVNAGLIDDLIAPRLATLAGETKEQDDESPKKTKSDFGWGISENIIVMGKDGGIGG